MLLSCVEDSLEPGPRKRPWTIIKRLFLAPDDIRRVGILLQVFADFLPREWMELLDACNGCISNTMRLAVFCQCKVYLASAVDHSFNATSVEYRVLEAWIRDDRMEFGFPDEVLHVRFYQRVAKQRF